MLFTALPFDYIALLDPGDRLRTVRGRKDASRVRRQPGRRER